MRARALSLVAALTAAATFAACSEQPTSPQLSARDQAVAGKNDKEKKEKHEKKDKHRAALLTAIPVTGALSDGGSFTGTFTAQRFDLDQATRELSITGQLIGTATDASGATTAIDQVVSAPATLSREAADVAAVAVKSSMMHQAAMATCDILFLDLGPLNLDLLGLTLDLNEVVLDLNAVSGAGNLLGNLLCAVTGLLDGFGLLASITQLLDSINNILAGLSAIGVSNVMPMGAHADIGFQFAT